MFWSIVAIIITLGILVYTIHYATDVYEKDGFIGVLPLLIVDGIAILTALLWSEDLMNAAMRLGASMAGSDSIVMIILSFVYNIFIGLGCSILLAIHEWLPPVAAVFAIISIMMGIGVTYETTIAEDNDSTILTRCLFSALFGILAGLFTRILIGAVLAVIVLKILSVLFSKPRCSNCKHYNGISCELCGRTIFDDENTTCDVHEYK